MCLYNNPLQLQDFLAKQKKNYIWGYKVIDVLIKDMDNITPKNILLCSKYYHFIWKPGLCKSNSRVVKPCIRSKEINHGIHVFIYKPDESFYNSLYTHIIIIKVRCPLKNIIGYDNLSKQAVFSSVYFSREEYRKAIKLFKLKYSYCYQ